MAKKVFISYRRTDVGYANNLVDTLKQRIGEENIFRDLEHMQGGYPFQQQLDQALQAVDNVLVLITPNWEAEIERRHQQGKTDFVLWEIKQAFAYEKRVIPVLFDRTMPNMQPYFDYEGGETLKKLEVYHAEEVHARTREVDYARLIKTMGIVNIPSYLEFVSLVQDLSLAQLRTCLAWFEPMSNIPGMATKDDIVGMLWDKIRTGQEDAWTTFEECYKREFPALYQRNQHKF